MAETPEATVAQPSAATAEQSRKAEAASAMSSLSGLKSQLLLFSGGSVGLGSLLGFLIYLNHCHRIAYLPALRLIEYADLFICLTIAGTICFVLAAGVPLLPGLYLLAIAPRKEAPESEHIKSRRLAGMLAIPGLMFACVGLFVRILGDSTPPWYWWVVSAALLFSVAIPVRLYVVKPTEATSARNSSEGQQNAPRWWKRCWEWAKRRWEWAKRWWATLIESGPYACLASVFTGFSTFLVVALIPATSYPNTGFFDNLVAVCGIAMLLVFSNALISQSRNIEARKIAQFMVAVYLGLVVLSIGGNLSEYVVRSFGLSSSRPIEITLREEDLARVPDSVRQQLGVQPDLSTNTYSIRGVYLVLRIGHDFRVGVPKNARKQLGNDNPLYSCWSIPDSCIVTWRAIDFDEIVYPAAPADSKRVADGAATRNRRE